MADRNTYLRYAFGALLCVPFACSDNVDHPGDARVLDVACASGGCKVSGSASKVSGLTSDSTGLRLGPGDGSVTIMVPALKLPGNDDTWTYEILARGRGTFGITCPTSSTSETGAEPTYDPAPTCISSAVPTGNFDWIPVGAEGRVGPANAGRTTLPTALTIGVSGGSTLEIVDVRIVSSESPKGC